MSTFSQRPEIPAHATDEPTVGAYAYHYGGLDPVRVVALLGSHIRVEVNGLELTVPKANYKFAVFPHEVTT